MNKTAFFYKFGYEAFGPVLFAFCNWIKSYCEKNDIEKIYFLSRDGKIVKQAYDILFDEDKKTNYFHASRRAIIVPSLHKIQSADEIFQRIAFNKKIKMKTFLKKVGLDSFDLNELLEKYGLNYEYIIDIQNYKLDENFCSVLNLILPVIKENSINEYKSFLEYSRKKSLSGKCAIVDIGWFGSMQNAMVELDNTLDLYGLYVGMVPDGKIFVSEKAKGFLFDSSHGRVVYDKFHYFISIFEFMFLAQEGSTKRYYNNENGYELYDYEYGKIKESEYSKIIQNAALDFIRANIGNTDIQEDNCTDMLLRYMLHPTYKEAKLFGDLLFLDDEELNIAKPKKLITYLFNYKLLINDFKNSSWRIGFLKRLIKIPFPSYQLNKILRKKFLKDKE